MIACPVTTRLSILAFEEALNLALPSNPQLPVMATIDTSVVSFVIGSPSNILNVTGFCNFESRLHVELQRAKWSSGSPCGASYLIPNLMNLWGAHRALTALTLDLLRGVSVLVLEGDWRLLLSAFPTLNILKVRIDSGRPLLKFLRKRLVCPGLETFMLTCNNGTGMHELLVCAIEFRAANWFRLKRLVFCRPRDDVPGQGVPWSTARIRRLTSAVETLQMKVFGWDTMQDSILLDSNMVVDVPGT